MSLRADFIISHYHGKQQLVFAFFVYFYWEIGERGVTAAGRLTTHLSFNLFGEY